MACMIGKTTNITAKDINKANQEVGELWTTVLQSRATIDYLLLQHNLGCQQFPGMCCFSVSEFSPSVDGQINDLHKEMDKISQVTF